MTLIRPQVLMPEAGDVKRMAVLGEKSEQPANLGVISAHRVRAAVGLELKPADVFMSSGLQGEWHVEAGHMIIDGRWGLSGL